MSGEDREVARVDPDRIQVGAGDRDRIADALRDVVRVDEQRGVLAQRGDLRPERRLLVVVQQRERVRCGAGGRDAVGQSGGQIRRVREPGEVGGARGGDGGSFVGSSGTHLDDRPASGRRNHPGRGRGDRAVEVEDRQHQRLQDDAFGERAGDGQDRRTREEQLALGVATDVAAELVSGQPGRGRVVDDAGRPEEVDVAIGEAEIREQLDQPPGAGDHAVPAAGRQPARENLEHAGPRRRTVPQRGVDHRQLILVGQQGGTEIAHSHPA